MYSKGLLLYNILSFFRAAYSIYIVSNLPISDYSVLISNKYLFPINISKVSNWNSTNLHMICYLGLYAMIDRIDG
jgi:hypothetical protein